MSTCFGVSTGTIIGRVCLHQNVSDETPDVERLRIRTAGEADVDPYEGVDTSSLPGWWQRAIEEFEENGLRPYRPPRFLDGELTHEVVDPLEDKLDIDIRFKGVAVTHEDDWSVYIDGEKIGEIGHHRSIEGYSVYEMESDHFVSWIRSEVG